eukprot:GHVR01170476.1.p1 GENE.GHVR01170476.1~~GHVR01170476.1.p1  ORF type:complete len:112 (-),score=51.73 GHVR01170476.1:59-355(-)
MDTLDKFNSQGGRHAGHTHTHTHTHTPSLMSAYSETNPFAKPHRPEPEWLDASHCNCTSTTCKSCPKALNDVQRLHQGNYGTKDTHTGFNKKPFGTHW